MLSLKPRILNFDNSLISQAKLLEQFKPLVIDLVDLGESSRFWLNRKSENILNNILSGIPLNHPTFIGSGDYHHISSLLIERFKQPLSVIIFDNHPDWDILPPRTGCGSWVTRVLGNDFVKKVILFGVASEDLLSPNIYTGNLKALEEDRLEIYPFSGFSTKVLLRHVPKNVSLKIKKHMLSKKISWNSLDCKELRSFANEVLSHIKTDKIYVSIDKDCLKSQYALTNWEEGLFELDDLLHILKQIKQTFDIAGLDITGEYSKIKINNKLKSVCSLLDHPKNYSAKSMPSEFINSVNQDTNIKILETMLGSDTVKRTNGV